MKKVALVFVIAVLAPSLVLAWLALRSQRDRASARAEADRIKDERRERAASTRTRLEQKQRR